MEKISFKTTKSYELRKNFNKKKYGPENKTSNCFNNKKTAFVKKTASVNPPQSSQTKSIAKPKEPVTTKFIKVKPKSSTAIHPNGLGHSDTKNENFIRRCSTTTTQTDATTNTAIEPCERAHITSKSWPTEVPKDGLLEFTDQRKCYEAASKSGQLRDTCMPNCTCKQPAATKYFSPVTNETDVEFDRPLGFLEDLQAFRLNNPDECFGRYSRSNLPLPRLKDLLSAWDENETIQRQRLKDITRVRNLAKTYVNEEPNREYSMKSDTNNNLIDAYFNAGKDYTLCNRCFYGEPEPVCYIRNRGGCSSAKRSSNKDSKQAHSLGFDNSCSTRNIHFNKKHNEDDLLYQMKQGNSSGNVCYIDKSKKKYSKDRKNSSSFNSRDSCYIQEPIEEYGIKNDMKDNKKILPPYAARQKLLQLEDNLHESEKSKQRKSSRNFLKNSLALRYQEML